MNVAKMNKNFFMIKFAVFFLAVVLVSLFCGSLYFYAENINPVETDVALEFVYPLAPDIEVGETQRVYVSFNNSDYANKSKLEFHKEGDDSQIVEASEVHNGIAEYSISHITNDDIGKYTLDNVYFDSEFPMFQKLKVNPHRGYTYGVYAKEDSLSDEELPAGIYDISGDGSITKGDKISDSQAKMMMSKDAMLLNPSINGNFVVALDAGHGGSDSGACGGDGALTEKYCNLRIAQACRDELSHYSGVSVYMVREYDETVGLQERVERARSAGANLFVCLHNNSGGGYGSEVGVQHPGGGESGFYDLGCDIANRVLDKLHNQFGLDNRGIKYRYCTDGSIYPDGTQGDYFSVLYWSRYYHIPGILIEHAFIDTQTSFLADESNLIRLGIADAQAIAETYGFQKDCPVPYVAHMFNNGMRIEGPTVPGAEKYAIAKGQNGQFFTYTNNWLDTNYTIENLENGNKYSFLVQSYKDGKWSSYSGYNFLNTTLIPLPEVSGVPSGDGKITFSGTPLTNASKYAIAQYDDGQFYNYTVDNTSCTFDIGNLENGVVQKFLIQGYFDNCGKWSDYNINALIDVVPEGKVKPEPYIKERYYYSLVPAGEPVSGAISYAIATKNDDGSYKTYTYGCTDTKYTITGLQPDTEYEILVQARFKHDRGSELDETLVIKGSTLNTVPDVNIVKEGDGFAAIQWPNIKDAQKYCVCECLNGQFRTIDNNIPSHEGIISYKVDNLANGYDHLLLVQSFIESQWSSHSSKYFVCVKPTGHTIPGNINAIQGTTSINLSGNKVPGADCYAIAMYLDNGQFINYSTNCYETNFIVTGLQTGFSYKFLIQAQIYGNGSGFQLPGDLFTISTIDIRPNVSVDSVSDGAVVLKWPKVDDADKYAIAECINGYYMNITTDFYTSDETLYFRIENVANEHTHYYLVQSHCGGSWSRFSESDFVKATPHGIIKPIVNNVSGGYKTIKLDGCPVPGSTCYAVATFENGVFNTYTLNCTDTSFVITNLQLNKTYHCLVQAQIYGVWSSYDLSKDLVDATTTDSRPKPVYVSQESGKVSFKGNKIDNADCYAIAEIKDGSYFTIDKAYVSDEPVINFTATNLANGYPHKFLVQSNIGGLGSPVDETSCVSGTPQGPTKPNVKSSTSEINSVTLYWDHVPGAEKYAVAVQNGGGYKTFTKDCIDCFYKVSEIRPKISYNFLVQAYIMGKGSTFDETDLGPASPKYDSSRPYPIVDKTEIGKIYLHWDPIPGAQYYAIARKSGDKFINFDVTGPDTQYVCQNDVSGGHYQILVQAYINGAYSAFDGGDLVECDVPFYQGTKIMSSPRTTVRQMMNYFNASGHTYRTEYSNYGAPDLETFCFLCYQEATDEGVDPAVLFCQAMHETGGLGFGGTVQWWQCNFGGIGATDTDPHPATFRDVRTGLRAQVQHLKAYGSRDGQLVHPLEDPRFYLVERGICPNVEDLSRHWASGDYYGKAIVESMNRLFQYPA